MGTATTYSTARSALRGGASCVLSDSLHNLSRGGRGCPPREITPVRKTARASPCCRLPRRRHTSSPFALPIWSPRAR